jgi:hypothetical protein
LADPGAPPAHDEIELSAFGPGYGESLLVHLGMGEWMIVDSCRKQGRLPALDYLESLGVEPAQAVTLIVATHWHDDHVRGISETLARCPKATMACSVALNHDELLAAIGRQPAGRFGKVTSGVDEMHAVLEHLDRTGQLQRLIWALQKLPLHERRDPLPCRVLALSPCHVVIGQAHRRLAELIVDNTMLRVQKPDRNEGAVVLWVEVGDATILLGADLQETPEDHTGWTAVVGCMEGVDRRSEIFKVPHHGSSNGYQELVWSDLLVENPEAVVCPHERGANLLPGPDDLAWLCQRAKVHLTAPPRSRDSSIRRGRLGRLAVVDFGRVTLRRRAGGATDWTVTYAPPAQYGCPG